MILLFKKGFPDSSVVKESACNAGDLSLIPGSGRSTGEGIGCPLHYSWVSLVAQLVKNPLQCGRPGFDPWVGKIPSRMKRLPTPVFWPREFCGLCSLWSCKELNMTERLWASLVAQKVKNLPTIDLGSVTGLGRSPGEGNGNPLQCSCLENFMDRGVWWATVHGIAKSWTQLSD